MVRLGAAVDTVGAALVVALLLTQYHLNQNDTNDTGVRDLRVKGSQITSNGHDTLFFPTLPDPSSLSHALGEGEHHFRGGEIHPLIVPT